MEKCHDYIQWLFPTDESSRYNLGAPLLTPKLQSVIREDQVILAAIQRSLAKFFLFLGVEMTRTNGVFVVSKAPHFQERVQDCWQGGGGKGMGGNHNWLRISRVLHCLTLIGLKAEAAGLLTFLETLPSEGIRCGSSLIHWRKRAAAADAVAAVAVADDAPPASERNKAP
jgi:hypothetical protein